MCLYAAVIKLFFNLNIFRCIEYTTEKFDLNQIHLECYIGESVKALRVAIVTKPTFQERNGSLFCWSTRAVNPQPCSRALQGLWHAQTLSDSHTATR